LRVSRCRPRYLDVIEAADMVDLNTPTKGCYILKPHGFQLWEAIRDALDARLKATGHTNVYFPALIPMSFLAREADHVQGFAKECAVVTHHRLGFDEEGVLRPDPASALAEPMVLRPTSETVIWDALKRWVHSHKDLPVRAAPS
jgi:prolyl-tRNA synthetase